MTRTKQYTALRKLSVNNRRKEFHFVKYLKNGQQAHLWVYSSCNWQYTDGSKDWRVGLYIGNSAKAARLWFRGKKKANITGDGSIEGLVWAMNMLTDVATMLPETDAILIDAEDYRRETLYNKMADRMYQKIVKDNVNTCSVHLWESEETM